jgi:UDP-N-acetylglucosamine:LPS N-acetylglucosamine transferase
LDSPGKYYIRKFVLEDEIGEVFHKADIFISRAGAHTTYEIKEFDKPAVLIPIPWVSHNEQYKNAELLVKEGLGVIVSEEDLACDTLLQKLSEISNRVSNSENFLTDYNVKPVEIIVDQINKLHDKKNSTR